MLHIPIRVTEILQLQRTETNIHNVRLQFQFPHSCTNGNTMSLNRRTHFRWHTPIQPETRLPWPYRKDGRKELTLYMTHNQNALKTDNVLLQRGHRCKEEELRTTKGTKLDDKFILVFFHLHVKTPWTQSKKETMTDIDNAVKSYLKMTWKTEPCYWSSTNFTHNWRCQVDLQLADTLLQSL